MLKSSRPQKFSVFSQTGYAVVGQHISSTKQQSRLNFMSIENIASIATIVESIFVVISVIFIWRELRENTKLTKASNTQSLVELSSPFNLQLIQDRQMAEYWVQGAKNWNFTD
ncbi:MAG TPA: hypothetical protein EYP90_12430 [Chromatiaceae bacterium]|nr:hypothetical protein [Chromatiaceae bacterium]